MTLIQQLAEGKIALENTGSLEDLRRVLKAAFPEDPWITEGTQKYYFKHWIKDHTYNMADTSLLPSQPTSEFIKELDNQTTTTMRTITSQQAQSIIDIACGTWKGKLATLWANKIVLKENIEISEESYQDMRKACTKEQHELFDRIFGKDTPQYNVGDCVITKNYSPHYDGRVLKITEISQLDYCYFETLGGSSFGGTPNFCKSYILRLATPEEIKAEAVIPEGTPCFVRGELKGSSWHLYYADGNGRFYLNGRKSGSSTVYWNQVRKYSDGLPEE